MDKLLAQQEINIGPLRGIGDLGFETTDPNTSIFVDTISKIIGVLTAAAILWFVFQFLIGGIQWISAGGDAKAVEAARSRITGAIIGLVIVFGALIIISVIGLLLGVDVLGAIGNLLRGRSGETDFPHGLDPSEGVL